MNRSRFAQGESRRAPPSSVGDHTGSLGSGLRKPLVPRYPLHALVVRSSGAAEPFYEVRITDNRVLVTRTSRRYAHTREIAASFSELDDGMRSVDTSVCSLLLDLRAIVGRNDPEFEAELAPLRSALLRRFRRAGFVVRTTIGRLQLERYLAEDGLDAEVFDNDDDAVLWLAAGD